MFILGNVTDCSINKPQTCDQMKCVCERDGGPAKNHSPHLHFGIIPIIMVLEILGALRE